MSRLNACDDENKNEFLKEKQMKGKIFIIFKKYMKFMKNKRRKLII